MADLASILTAYLIAQGSHTGGHFDEASKIGVPISMKGITSEQWGEPTETKTRPVYSFVRTVNHDDEKKIKVQSGIETYQSPDKRASTDLNGAGFRSQDAIRDSMSGKTREDVSTMNAILKALYIAGLPTMLNGNKGDIKQMQELSGNKYVPHMVGLSALSDLLQTKDSKNSLSFTVSNGKPGLLFNRRF